MTSRIDLNADLGEGFGRWRMGDDEQILQVVTSANVACGFHAGDPSIMRSVFAAAAKAGVSVGAHVAYPDLAGFGRRFIDIDPQTLTDGIIYQIGAASALAAASGTTINYVKPHGALYNTIATHPEQAAAVVAAMKALADGAGPGPVPLVAQSSALVAVLSAQAGITVVAEAFIDRAYQRDGRLVPRGQPGAVLHDPEAAAGRALQLVTEGTVTTIDGETIPMRAQTLCTHGDTDDAVSVLRHVRNVLQENGIEVRSFM